MRITGDDWRSDAAEERVKAPALTWAGSLLMIMWFGFVAGGLELGLVLARRAFDDHISTEMTRTNRHYVWMVPVSGVLIFAAAGILVVLFARFCPKLARWLALRLPVAMGFSTLLLTIEGLYAIAGITLACGFASVIGPWIGRRSAGFSRLVRISLPVMVVGLIVLTGLSYQHVTTAERRALSLCPSPKPGQPNVLLIVLDDVRAASLSLYGHERRTSPYLEWLARRGLIFTEARSTAPWTLPTHASMFTGRWPHELSVGPDRPLDGTFPTLAETLAREGYATAGFVGNTFYGSAQYGLDRGFARYEDAYETQTVSLYETIRSSSLGRRLVPGVDDPVQAAAGFTSARKSAEMINHDVLDWLGKRPADQPYFVFINYFDAHSPFVPPEGPSPRFGLGALPFAERLAIDTRYMEFLAGKPSPAGFSPERVVNEAINMYRDSYESCIAHIDRQLGLLMEELERRGSLENTLVIVTSDHGEHFGEHTLVGHGLSLYRREVHVPLLIIPPTPLATPRIVNEPVSLREIPATVAQWVDLDARNPFPGRSLTRFQDDGTVGFTESSPVLCEVQQIEGFPSVLKVPSSFGPIASMVAQERVYIRNHDGREELYDLASHPESEDLAREPESRGVIDRFREEYDRFSGEPATPGQ